MLDVSVKHGQRSKAWGEHMWKCSLKVRGPGFSLLWTLFANLPLFPPRADIRLFAHAHKQLSIPHYPLAYFQIGCGLGTCTDVFENFPFQVQKEKKKWNLTSTVCLRSFTSCRKSAKGQLSGGHRSEQSALIGLNRQFKWPVSPRGWTEGLKESV